MGAVFALFDAFDDRDDAGCTAALGHLRRLYAIQTWKARFLLHSANEKSPQSPVIQSFGTINVPHNRGGKPMALIIRTIEAGGYKLRVGTSQESPGSLPLFLFNGLGANLELLQPFAEEMGKYGVGVVSFDVPGIGGSSAPTVPYRFSSLSRVANEVLVRLGITVQVDLLGVSWGGGFAQAFTHQYPARVRRLVLAATTAGAVAVPGSFSALMNLLRPRRYERGQYARIAADIYGGTVQSHPELLEHYVKLFRAPNGIGFGFQLLSGVGWTSVYWLHRLRQPTLVMMGTDDRLVPVVNGQLLAALIPNARLVTIPDGHLFLLTSARQCATIIHDFLVERAFLESAASGITLSEIVTRAIKAFLASASRHG
jgi:poly(3-hydroxyalkanoate) depolymerase